MTGPENWVGPGYRVGPGHRVGLVGASGAVGRELLSLLAARGIESIRRLGRPDPRSTEHRVEETVPLSDAALTGLDLIFFCAPGEVAEEWVPRAARVGAMVIDNSSAFRAAPDIPLVIPEVNGHLLNADPPPRVVANPNCSTILLLMAIAPIHDALGCERLEVTTYQAVSGAGLRAIEELEDATRADLTGGEYVPAVFREPAAFNVFSHDSAVDPETGCNGEEEKVVREVARILDRPPRVAATCIRVPVRRSHCEAVSLSLSHPATESRVRDILRDAPGVRLVDDRETQCFPSARRAEGRNEVLVGRLRPDRSYPAVGRDAGDEELWSHFQLFLAGDQLLKGAALNALQIADRCGLEVWR